MEAKAERELAEGAILSSPGKQNVQLPDELERAVESLFQELGQAKRPDAALLLPDACARLTTLDFDQLPGDGKERLELIRLRLKKTLPFDVDAGADRLPGTAHTGRMGLTCRSDTARSCQTV